MEETPYCESMEPAEPMKSAAEITLHKHLQTVAFTTAKMLSVAAITSVVTMPIMVYAMMRSNLFWGLFVSIAIGEFYTLYQTTNDENTIEQKMKYAYGFSIFVGMLLVPPLIVYSEFVVPAAILTMVLTTSLIGFALWMPKGSLLWLGPLLMTCLMGLLGISLYTLMTLGRTSDPIEMIGLVGGTIVFSLYNAYDTHVVISEFEKGERNYVKHSVNYFLNIINLFLKLLKLLAKMKAKSKKN